MKGRIILWVLCLTTLLLAGCGPDYRGQYQEAVEKQYGTVSQGVYQNRWAGLEMTLPEGWHTQADPIREALEKASEQVKDSQSLEKSLQDLAAVPVYNLVQVFQLPPAESQAFNPSLVVMVEPVQGKGVDNAAAYLEVSRTVMGQRQMPMGFTQQLDAPLDTVALGGEAFAHLPVTIGTGLFEIHQDYYALMLDDGRMLGLLATWRDEAERQEILAALETLKLSR